MICWCSIRLYLISQTEYLKPVQVEQGCLWSSITTTLIFLITQGSSKHYCKDGNSSSLKPLYLPTRAKLCIELVKKGLMAKGWKFNAWPVTLMHAKKVIVSSSDYFRERDSCRLLYTTRGYHTGAWCCRPHGPYLARQFLKLHRSLNFLAVAVKFGTNVVPWLSNKCLNFQLLHYL